MIDALEEVAANHNASVPQIAYAWVRDRPNVGPIVIAARNEAQLEENIASYKIKLKQDEHSLIEKSGAPGADLPELAPCDERARDGEPIRDWLFERL